MVLGFSISLNASVNPMQLDIDRQHKIRDPRVKFAVDRSSLSRHV